MTIELKTLEIFPRSEQNGWGTGRLRFGEFLTFVRGPNGSGKTPLLKALVSALGIPTAIPSPVREHIASIAIDIIATDGSPASIRREVLDSGRVTISSAGRTESLEESEKSLSNAILPMLGFQQRQLSDKAGRPSSLYLSIVAPTFWIDQDTGWTQTYAVSPARSFIPDQEEEVLRAVFAVPQKRAFIDRSEIDRNEAELAAIDERIAAKRRALEERVSLGEFDTSSSLADLEVERDTVGRTLMALQKDAATAQAVGGKFDGPIEVERSAISRLLAQFESLQRRRAAMARVSTELQLESEVLELNAEATDTFRSFCTSERCGLFKKSEVSYGRRLLALRDRSKDLDSTRTLVDQELETLQAQIKKREASIRSLETLKDESLSGSGLEAIASSIREAAGLLAQVEVRLARKVQFDADRDELDKLLQRRGSVQERVDSLRKALRRKDQSQIPDVARTLESALVRWLECLDAQNLGRPRVDTELKVHFGEERFRLGSSQSGSTRTRIVLAFHAAVLETSLLMGGAHPGILILDAPKQHELSGEALNRYIDALRGLRRRHHGGVQVVFSASDVDIRADQNDLVWAPKFAFPEGMRFIGPPKARTH